MKNRKSKTYNLRHNIHICVLYNGCIIVVQFPVSLRGRLGNVSKLKLHLLPRDQILLSYKYICQHVCGTDVFGQFYFSGMCHIWCLEYAIGRQRRCQPGTIPSRCTYKQGGVRVNFRTFTDLIHMTKSFSKPGHFTFHNSTSLHHFLMLTLSTLLPHFKIF